MIKIIFWNVEHLSPEVVQRAEQAAEDKRAALKELHRGAGGARSHEPTPAITRSMVATPRISMKPQVAAARLRGRVVEAERQAHVLFNAADGRAHQLRNKANLADQLPQSAPHVFFCEVVSTHANAQNPLRGFNPPGGPMNCYAYFDHGVSADFDDCPVDSQWYQGAALNPQARVPKSVQVVHHTVGNIDLCFWHAPSNNGGGIVVQMFNGLVAGARQFILFGDLNAEPHELQQHGLNPGNVRRPVGGTRISGRCLDYAITNVGCRMECRPLFPAAENYAIKVRTGSDHMAMVLEIH